MEPFSRPYKISSNASDVDLLAPGLHKPCRRIHVGGDGNLVFVPSTNADGDTPGASVSWPVVAGDVVDVQASTIKSTNTALPLLVLY